MGNVYVADAKNIRIQKFDPQGRFLMKFGIGGWLRGAGPTGTAIDKNGNIYVTDNFNHRVQMFSVS